jgi:phage terminase large subunit-like protein
MVSHVGTFPALEDQMTNFSTAGYQGSRSPDRADALVWALSELMIKPTLDYTGWV